VAATACSTWSPSSHSPTTSNRPAEAAVVRADPDAALADGPFPLLVDEWQVVPQVLGAVKRAVDEGATAGSFVLTGSSQADLTAAGWPATGALIRVPMYGLAERELEHGTSQRPVLDRLVSEGAEALSVPPDPPDIRGYVARALRGGFPDAALAASDRASRRWLASYVDQLVSRDVSLVGAVRDPMRLRHYLQAVAASTAGTPTLKTLLDATGIERPTANAYDALLEQLLVTERIPSWSFNQLNRLIRLRNVTWSTPRPSARCWAWTPGRSFATATCWADFSTASSWRNCGPSAR
jgi:uncharacterized protein